MYLLTLVVTSCGPSTNSNKQLANSMNSKWKTCKNARISSATSAVCLSIRTLQLDKQWTDFEKI
jgi:hypothetical protein